jgi:hypothetical protein
VAKTNPASHLQDTFSTASAPLRRMLDATAEFSAHPNEDTLRAFDAAFAETVRALAKDAPGQSAEMHRQSLVNLLASFREAFPDLHEPCLFLERILNAERRFAAAKIEAALLPGHSG